MGNLGDLEAFQIKTQQCTVEEKQLLKLLGLHLRILMGNLGYLYRSFSETGTIQSSFTDPMFFKISANLHTLLPLGRELVALCIQESNGKLF